MILSEVCLWHGQGNWYQNHFSEIGVATRLLYLEQPYELFTEGQSQIENPRRLIRTAELTLFFHQHLEISLYWLTWNASNKFEENFANTITTLKVNFVTFPLQNRKIYKLLF